MYDDVHNKYAHIQWNFFLNILFFHYLKVKVSFAIPASMLIDNVAAFERKTQVVLLYYYYNRADI